jgi:hypothetical protein
VVPAYTEENLTAFETTAMVLGQRRRVILTHCPGLHTAQQGGFAQTLRKATAALTELAARLARGRTRRPPAKVQAEIDTRHAAPGLVDRPHRAGRPGGGDLR